MKDWHLLLCKPQIVLLSCYCFCFLLVRDHYSSHSNTNDLIAVVAVNDTAMQSESLALSTMS